MSRWETFISRLPQRIRLQSDAERLLDADLPILRRFQYRVSINEPRSECARQFREELAAKEAAEALERKRVNVTKWRFDNVRRASARAASTR